MKLLLLITVFLVLTGVNSSGNPFSGVSFYVDQDYKNEVSSSMKLHPSLASLLEKAEYSVAYWIDRMAKIPNMTQVLNGAKNANKLQIFVIYDLPNRDCAAAASNGEILCADSACTAGLNTYKTQYIDPIVKKFKEYPNNHLVAVIEPDSLPNLATNLNIQKCSEAQTAYKSGVAYAIQQLSEIPNIALYVDAAHGGWLGWDNNRQKFAAIMQTVLSLAGGNNKIRGFSTNVANYQPLGSINDPADPCNLESQYNNATCEVKYVNLLSQTLAQAGITDKYFIIDTSRNGVTNMRKDCSNWCNIKGAGIGARPTSDTSASGIDIIDAYVWVKVPGESDGTTNTSSSRYDFHCRSQDSIIPAPQAGDWFDSDFVALCQNAVPPL